MTQPGEAMDVETIIRNYAQGVQLQGREPQYYDDDFSEFDQMDFFEREQFIRDNEQYINELRTRISKDQAEPDRPLPSDGLNIQPDGSTTPPVSGVGEADSGQSAATPAKA